MNVGLCFEACIFIQGGFLVCRDTGLKFSYFSQHPSNYFWPVWPSGSETTITMVIFNCQIQCNVIKVSRNFLFSLYFLSKSFIFIVASQSGKPTEILDELGIFAAPLDSRLLTGGFR